MPRLWLKFGGIAGCAALLVALGLLLMASTGPEPFGDGDGYMALLAWLLLLGSPVSLIASRFDFPDFLGDYSVALAGIFALVLNWMILGAIVGWVVGVLRRRPLRPRA